MKKSKKGKVKYSPAVPVDRNPKGAVNKSSRIFGRSKKGIRD
jgi:hypothetical protein